MSNEELIDLAKKETDKAIVKNTGCKMGSIVICKNGNKYYGCNIEAASSCSLSNCAERVAIQSAIASGETEFEKIVTNGIIDGKEVEITAPCGVCRQYMIEFTPGIKVVFKYKGEVIEKKVEDLEPYLYDFKK